MRTAAPVGFDFQYTATQLLRRILKEGATFSRTGSTLTVDSTLTLNPDEEYLLWIIGTTPEVP